MAIDEIVHNLPPELKLVVLYFMVRTPKVHFLKPFKAYNGGLKDAGPDTPFNFPGQWNDDGEPGVEEVSPLSGACKLSKALMEVNDDLNSDRATTKVSLDHLTSIALNPPMFPINTVKPGVPHVKVDMINDLFCVSSNGQGPHFPDQRFTGGRSLQHKILKDMHRICLGLPNFDLAAQDYRCQDCGEVYQDDPTAFPNDRTEFCTECIGLWFAQLHNLEQVYIIVPGLPRAQKTDKRYISRYGEAATVMQVLGEARQNDPTWEFLGARALKVDNRRESGAVMTSPSIEGFGAEGPRSFDGDGITLYEVPVTTVPLDAAEFMTTVVRSYAKTRVLWTNVTGGAIPPAIPKNPVLCGGMVEFKFLSFGLDP